MLLLYTYALHISKKGRRNKTLTRNDILRRQLLLQNVLEGNSIGSKLADTLAELLNSHLVLVEVESEQGLVLDV